MSGKAKYKSAIRSKKMIRHAFVELVLEMDLTKITVKNIVERAEVSRGTFYAHYSDIYAVIEEIENETMGKMVEFINDFTAIDLIRNPMPLLLKISRFFEQDIEFYRMLVYTHGSQPFISKLGNILIEKMLTHRKTLPSNQEREAYTMQVHFFVGGLTSIYQDWFTGKVEGSLDNLTTSVSRIMIQGFKSFDLK